LPVYKSNQEKGWGKKEKKRKAKQRGGGPAPPSYTPTEELNVNLPIVEGIPGFSSSSDSQPEARSSNTFTAGKWTL